MNYLKKTQQTQTKILFYASNETTQEVFLTKKGKK